MFIDVYRTVPLKEKQGKQSLSWSLLSEIKTSENAILSL